MSAKLWAAAAAVVLALAGCGGGGSDAGCSFEGRNCDDNPATQTVGQLRLTLSSANVSNGTMGAVTATATALSAENKALEGVDVVYSVQDQSALAEDSGAYVENDTGATGTDGRSTATVNLGSDKSNRVITVTAAAGGKSVSRTISLRGTDIEGNPNTLVDPQTQETIVFTVQDSNNVGIEGVAISVQASGGLGTKSGTTDANGSYTYTYTVPNAPGSTLAFNVTAAGVSKQFLATVKQPAQVLPPPDLTGGLTPALQVNPEVVAVNSTGSTANKMQVVATFENLQGQPIANMRVSFRLVGAQAAAIGGQFANGNGALATLPTPVQISDANGKVQNFYIPGTRSSSNNIVSIQVCYGETDAEALNCSNSTRIRSKTITVADEAVSVTIGTDGLLDPQSVPLSYMQRFIVKVVNSAGQPRAGLQVSAQVNTVSYFKGFYTRGASAWGILPGDRVQCAKEDLDDDDRLDTAPVNEDVDHDTRLEPIRADVSLTAENNNWVTNDDGIVILRMAYPKNVATWMTVNIQASSLVGGSEGRASRQQLLNALVDDVKAEGEPAFRFSPYGVETGDVLLAADRTMPDGFVVQSGETLTPCQNPD